MAQDVVLRNLCSEDLREVALIHLSAFPESALTKLGLGAVRRYYEWLLDGPHDAINLGAFVDLQITGFCFGGVFRGAMSGFLQNNRAFLCSRVLLRPWIAAHRDFREALAGGLRVLKRAGERKQQLVNPAKPKQQPFGILAIAVRPDHGRRGVGQLLMERSEDIARQRGFPEMVLTVETSNCRAIAFYEKLGWTKVFVDGGWRGRMMKPLDAVV